jgi:hypothetical protein
MKNVSMVTLDSTAVLDGRGNQEWNTTTIRGRCFLLRQPGVTKGINNPEEKLAINGQLRVEAGQNISTVAPRV